MFLKIHIADQKEAKKLLPNYFKINAGEERASYLKCKDVPIDIDFGTEEDLLWEAHDKAVKSLRGVGHGGEIGGKEGGMKGGKNDGMKGKRQGKGVFPYHRNSYGIIGRRRRGTVGPRKNSKGRNRIEQWIGQEGEEGGQEGKKGAAENPKASLLDLKLRLARKMLLACNLCERRCGANRFKGNKGHCGVLQPRISSEFVHWGEEPELVPSHTVFFAGCTFNCVFCQNWDISQNPKNGRTVSPRRIAELVERRSESTMNTNWVGGDPTSDLPFIIEALTNCGANTPQVWNSNLYLTERSMDLLNGIIDLYLTDFKYGNNQCAERLSKVKGYWEVITRNHELARAQGEMIIRHLVLPGHFECCSKPVLEWIAESLKDVRVNVMDQFRPEYDAYDYRELVKRLDRDEFMRAYDLARDLGLSLTD